LGLGNDYIVNQNGKDWGDTTTTKDFFDNIIPNGWTDLNNLITKICDTIKEVLNQNKDAVVLNITIPIETNTSYLNVSVNNYNKDLSERRKIALIKYIKEQVKKQIPGIVESRIKFDGSVKKYQENKNSLDQGSVVETPSVDLNDKTKVELEDENSLRSVYSKESYLYRYAVINGASVKIVYSDGTVQNLADKVNKDNAELQLKLDYYNSLFRRLRAGVLQPFNKECDMFEQIKENSPFLYDKLIEKLKFFHPAFHSTTPEGFNSRLTFLQQCAKAGDSIDTSVVTNTVFGPPPVCILRIGDFYHTKVVFNSINISYDPLVWDMNYEGVGMQPMIANITMGFSYIGGSSLGGPINELQNALSFNYFANTNLYDNRAKLSKDEEDYLNQILERLNNQEVAEAKRKQEEMEMIEEANFRPTELDVIVDTNTNNDIGVEQVPSMMNQDRA